MSKEQMQELMVGAVVVVLAYALYTHFKRPAAAKVAGVAPYVPNYEPGGLGPYNPPGAEYSAADQGRYVSVDNLIYGAATGQSWDVMPSIEDLTYTAVYGGGKPKPNGLLLPSSLLY